MSVTVSNLPRSLEEPAAAGSLAHTGLVEPTAEEIRRQLDRILASDGFANADRMTGFLRYVVERSLAGESGQVKEYAIGVDVFGRNGDYDPRLDSIVRVEARRLRAKVDEYYQHAGADDPIVIRLRRGSYVPAFERRAAAAPIASSAAPPVTTPAGPSSPVPASLPRSRPVRWRIGAALFVAGLALAAVAARGGLWATTGTKPEVSVAVLPFAEYSSDEADRLIAARLTDGVTRELARLGTIGVVSHTSALQFAGQRKRASEIAKALGADVVMEGSVTRSGDRISVSVRLVHGATDRKTWVYDVDGTTAEPRKLETEIARLAAPAILKTQRR